MPPSSCRNFLRISDSLTLLRLNFTIGQWIMSPKSINLFTSWECLLILLIDLVLSRVIPLTMVWMLLGDTPGCSVVLFKSHFSHLLHTCICIFCSTHQSRAFWHNFTSFQGSWKRKTGHNSSNTCGWTIFIVEPRNPHKGHKIRGEFFDLSCSVHLVSTACLSILGEGSLLFLRYLSFSPV